MTTMDPARVVEQGYDALDDTYPRWVRRAGDGYRSAFLARILAQVPPGADVLEIGCGPGTDAAALADGRRYTGVDLSSVQLEHAKRAAPAGTFLHADIANVTFPSSSFDAVVGLYVFNHIPPDRIAASFGRMHTWLRPRGRLFASFGTSDNPGAVEEGWLDRVDMFFASLPVDENDALLQEAGFAIEFAETVTEDEEGKGPATFHWVIARNRPGGETSSP